MTGMGTRPTKATLHRLSLAAVLVGVFLTLAAALPEVTQQAPDFPKPSFNEDGNLIRPDVSYRQWVYVGTPLTPNDLNPPEAPFPDFHNVYIHPDDFDHYSRTGDFPQGTVIVKELVSVGSKQAVSGNGYFMGEFIGLETTIKDAERFPEEPGNWAYFSFGHSYPLADEAAALPPAACNGCHEASAADDFVFTQYYPILSAAKGPGTAGNPNSGQVMDQDNPEFQAIKTAMADALEAGMGGTAPRGRAPGDVPTADGALHDYLRAGTYTEMPAVEAGRHPSAGPHARFGAPVRVFINATLAASLDAGNEQHPVGSEAVKEMYLTNGTLEGWAVMVKTQEDSDSGRGWFWYEATSTEPGANPFMSGNGIPLCAGCHSTGSDYLLTRWPLR